ncbi:MULTISPECIES: aminoglycoside phosphotransferase family protein [unclassified Streptomyces]|uniref:aminoglycoside phosphotransferase family protein n=1 Tax=unclassified Streptomyces TaxID=2593676 RepID=UPI002365A59B|nr:MULTISPECIES: aminoglycoside phosphotransferase family protein [unclassified Streptomyces]MDF3141050.1 aminoglycoside phosphotransferase family protein [Streptomyces sp. T21Q-yed]WDF39267.1 aminoglycoside phosphotransferase family protein [Streptomyces sp. T12]
MSPEPVSVTGQRAVEMSGTAEVITGPLQGYHHETYVLALPGRTDAVKCREPRDGLLWFDRRCFRSEEQLLRELSGRITRIPEVLEIAGMGLQLFIEGRTIGARRWTGRRVPEAILDQIVDLFREMARITPSSLSAERRCLSQDRTEDGDTNGFLERLIAFVEERVHDANSRQFGALFMSLGVGSDAFVHLRKHVLVGLSERPFCLLHADLHRENFIVDDEGRLWTIDWELAMLGDPLYDLATHLYLMRYPSDQQRRMTEEWCRAAERVRPGSSRGWAGDLPLLLDFKRAQSVFTDVIRVSLSLLHGTEIDWVALPQAAGKLQRVLAAAAVPLGLVDLPTRSQIMAALVSWLRSTAMAPA